MKTSDALREVTARPEANEGLYHEWQLCAERAKVGDDIRSRIVHANSHMDAMREARELSDSLHAASTLAYERYTAALRGEL